MIACVNCASIPTGEFATLMWSTIAAYSSFVLDIGSEVISLHLSLNDQLRRSTTPTIGTDDSHRFRLYASASGAAASGATAKAKMPAGSMNALSGISPVSPRNSTTKTAIPTSHAIAAP